MSKGEILLSLLREGREWLKLLLPVFLAWHLPCPFPKSKNPPEEK